MGDSLRALGLVARTSFQASPPGAVALVVLAVVRALAAPLLAVAAGLLVNAVVHGDARGTTVAGLALAACVGGRWLAGGLATLIGLRLQREVMFRLDGHLIAADGDLPGIEHHERPDYLAQLDLLRDEYWQLGWCLTESVEALLLVVQWAATAAILLHLQPLLILLPLCGLPSLAAAAHAGRLAQRAAEGAVEHVRREAHLFALGTAPAAGKELRAFGLAATLLRRHRAAASAAIAARHAARRAAAPAGFLGQAAYALGYVGAVGLVTWRALAGAASAGDVVVVVALAGQVGGLVGQSAATLDGLLGVLRVVARLRWLERYAARREVALGIPAPARLAQGITLRDVRFRYSGAAADVLRGIDLALPAGATVALVGENGAGKTTLVKLLCGFYRPTAGRITVDGADLAALDVRSWRRALAGAFQDYARFELTAGETVGVGDVAALAEEGDRAVLAALERAAAQDMVAVLPRGLATPLGAGWEGAVDLSGGQWQKLALGRARMRRHPLLLLLDEPTAALDAGAEHALFERFAGAAREVRENGGITLLVSHRFSTVRMADLIVVLDQGRVREAGTHDELVARGDLYAGLYALQARAYGRLAHRQPPA